MVVAVDGRWDACGIKESGRPPVPFCEWEKGGKWDGATAGLRYQMGTEDAERGCNISP